MIPPGRRLGQIRDLVDGEKFFIVHGPRQTGKTTLLRNLSRQLTAEEVYAAVTVSLESFTEPSVERMMPQIVEEISASARQQLPEHLAPPSAADISKSWSRALKDYLSTWSDNIDAPLVVFFDEVDSVPGEVLLSVLRQLRDGYTSRPAPFPMSMALVGLRDVRDYQIRIRNDSQSLGTASPFNIKDESLVLPNFNEQEVRELLGQHTEETGQRFESAADGAIFYQSGGQPWLVNALAAQLTTRYDALVKDRSAVVTRDHVLEAREILIERRDTHLDSLADKLREERVRRVIEPILVGEPSFDTTFDDDFSYTRDLGLVSNAGGKIEISNPIYREIIPRVLSFQAQMGIPDEPEWYVADDGTLDMRKLIDGFLEFWRENGEILLRGMQYQEAAPHLVFMAYLQRITNSGGRVDREFAIGTRRADLVVDFGGRRDIIELKLASAYKSLERGLAQVSSYAQRLGRDMGYLVMFDTGSESPWEERGEIEEVAADGVTVVVVRC